MSCILNHMWGGVRHREHTFLHIDDNFQRTSVFSSAATQGRGERGGAREGERGNGECTTKKLLSAGEHGPQKNIPESIAPQAGAARGEGGRRGTEAWRLRNTCCPGCVARAPSDRPYSSAGVLSRGTRGRGPVYGEGGSVDEAEIGGGGGMAELGQGES